MLLAHRLANRNRFFGGANQTGPTPRPGVSRSVDKSDGKAGAAAAGGNRVRIPDLERLAHQVVDEVDHRAAHIDERQIVDQHGGAVLFDGDVVVVAAVDEVELVGEAGAAAAFDRNAQRRSCRARSRRSLRCASRRRRSRRLSWQSWHQRPLASPCPVTCFHTQ